MGKRTMIVTGGATGLGRSIAETASDQEYRVGVLDIDGDGAAAVAALLADGVPLTASVTDEEQVEAALDVFGAIPDVLVNNAGIVRFGPLVDLSLEDWQAVVTTNLTGTFVCARAAARRMAERGSGTIINMTSIGGVAPNPNAGSYGPTKSGVASVTRQMAIEWGPVGIRVNAVAPGMIDGGMSAPIFADPQFRALRTAKVPSGRLGECQDVADAVLFLASDQASYVNGHELVVDGAVVHSILSQLPRPRAVDSVGEGG